MTREEEYALVQRIQSGDSDAFAVLMDLYQKQVYHLALRTVGNPEDAADMTQEAFLRAYRAIGSFRGDSKLSVWLYRLTQNAAYTIDGKDWYLSHAYEREGGVSRLILREINGLSYAEIGEQLQLEEGTVKSRLFRARKKLCEFLQRDGNLPDTYASKNINGGVKQ